MVDDPWINDGYGDSPISIDVGETVIEDEAIIKQVESKFKLDRDSVLKALRDGSYNDIAAIYYLLYYNQENRDSRMPSDSPNSDIIQVSSRTKEKSVVILTPAMGKIEEDAIAHQDETTATPATVVSQPVQSVKHSSATAQARRKRAQTFGGDNLKDDNKELPKDDAATKETAKVDNRPKTSTVGDNGPERNPSVRSIKSSISSRKDVPASIVIAASPSPSANSNNGAIRGRTNTIVGIFKRRPSEMEGQTSPITPNANAYGEDVNKPRSLRFTFNSNTTSSKPPDEIMLAVIKICNNKSITHRLQSRYLLECTFGQTSIGKEPVKFEVEVCKLPRLNNLHGLRFKRLAGASSDYKDVCEMLLSSVQL